MSTDITVSPLRQRMVEDMAARKLGPHSQRSHIYSCKRFAAFLKRSPDTATADDIRRFAGWLRREGVEVAIRKSRGMDIAAACGQLRAERLRRRPPRDAEHHRDVHVA